MHSSIQPASLNPAHQSASKTSRTSRWLEFLTRPIDGASLAIFRICFGLVLLFEVGRYFVFDFIGETYVEPEFLFTFLPFIDRWPGNGMYWHFGILGVCAFLMAIGLFYRMAATVFCVGFTYVFLLEKAHYLNHFYLICLLSFLLALVPAHHCWSADRFRLKSKLPNWIPNWSLLIFKAQLVLVYSYAGIAKINPDWLRGEPQRSWLAAKTHLPWVGPYLTNETVVWLLTYGGIGIDLSVGFLLLWRRTFWPAAIVSILFHLSNALLFTIGIFPFLMIGTLALFPAPDWPRTVWRRWCEARRRKARPSSQAAPPIPPPLPHRLVSFPPAQDLAVISLLHIYMALQLLIPFRHLLYPGNVHWTEEGHRFSWHMMLRHKDADILMFLTDSKSNLRQRIDLEKELTDRQRRKMSTRPDMIQQFAHYIADRYQAEHGVRPAVNAIVTASLNNHPAQYLIDPKVDLAAQPRSLRHKPWILPLAPSQSPSNRARNDP